MLYAAESGGHEINMNATARETDVPAERPRSWGLTRSDIERIATSVASQLGYLPGQDLQPLIRRIGGDIEVAPDEDGASLSGSIDVRGPSDFTIYLPLHTGRLRDRFTIAHELGHLVLHYVYPNAAKQAGIERLTAERYGSGRPEIEANWFAAAFLMPSELFRQAFMDAGGNLAAVSTEFGVSPHAASIRANSLGLA